MTLIELGEELVGSIAVGAQSTCSHFLEIFLLVIFTDSVEGKGRFIFSIF